MSFVTFVSGRYLKTRQKRAFISLITGLSIAGVTVGVMALIVVIAVMAGFETDLKSRIMGIRPHLLINKNKGTYPDYEKTLKRLKTIDGIESASAYITSQVVLRTTLRATGAILKGVDANIEKNGIQGVHIDRLTAGKDGKRAPETGQHLPGIILGKALAANLGVITGDTIYMISPRGMLSPIGHMPAMIKFRVVDLFASGMYEFDGTLAFIDLSQAQKMLRMDHCVTGIEIRLTDMDRAKMVMAAVKRVLPPDDRVKDWKQINKNLFSALRLEKTVMFIILTLIILVATFNIAGSLVMMVMEKKKDIAILKTMGATSNTIGKIFIIKGLIIGLVGTMIGTLAGLVLCNLLERYRFIHLPADVFTITTLPVNPKAADVLIITTSALLICFLATIYPARKAAAIDPVEAIRHG